MIKLIASDIDGTLIQTYPNNILSSKLFDQIRECNEKGIQFVAASGRTYCNLKTIFLPVWRDIYFCAENGNAIFKNDELIYSLSIPNELVREIIDVVGDRKDCAQSFNTPYKFMLFQEPKDFVDLIFYQNKTTTVIIDSYDQIYEENIVKMSLYVTTGDIDEITALLKEHFEDRLLITKSGGKWIDICLSGKGSAIRRVMADLNVKPSEAVAFGDNFNDIEMFMAVEHSFAMLNAEDEVKSYAKNISTIVEDNIEIILNNKN